MKKLILILVVFISTGCVDYKELNSLSYVTGIGIDYLNEEFIFTYEVMDNKKEGSSVETRTYVLSGKGNTIFEAKMDATNKLNATPYFSHTQIIILTDEIVNEKLYDVTDFIIRNPKFNEEFLFVMTYNNTPAEILNNTSTENPSASLYIEGLTSDNTYSNNFYVNLPFNDFAKNVFEDKIDAGVSIIKLSEDDIILDGLAAFNGEKIAYKLSNEQSNIYNSFLNNTVNIILASDYKGETVEALTKFENTKIDVKSNDIHISIEAIVEIKKNPSNLDLYDNNTYKELSETLEDELQSQISDLVKLLQEKNSDLLGFEKNYYISTRKNNNNLWRYANINVDTNLTISRKGLIYNVYN